MSKQSSAPAVLLTRPPGQSARFAEQLAGRFGPLDMVVSPLLAPENLPVEVPLPPVTGVIFTSETGAAAAGGLGLGPLPAYCVGPQTAAAAAVAGFRSTAIGGNADGLIAGLLALRLKGPLLHLHGAETRGDVAARLTAGGLATTGLAVYAQRPQPLTAEAMELLAGRKPVAVPLFSPRSAALFAEAARAARAPLWVAALSPSVAEALDLPDARLAVARKPQADALLDAMAEFLPPQRGA